MPIIPGEQLTPGLHTVAALLSLFVGEAYGPALPLGFTQLRRNQIPGIYDSTTMTLNCVFPFWFMLLPLELSISPLPFAGGALPSTSQKYSIREWCVHLGNSWRSHYQLDTFCGLIPDGNSKWPYGTPPGWRPLSEATPPANPGTTAGLAHAGLVALVPEEEVPASTIWVPPYMLCCPRCDNVFDNFWWCSVSTSNTPQAQCVL